MNTKDLTTEEGILSYLQSDPYPSCAKATKAERLPEGAAGFVYRVHLDDSEWPTVIVKHAEPYAARARQWKLDQNRMQYEQKGLEYLSTPNMQSGSRVRAPKLLFYDDDNHILVMEDVGSLPSLKGWLQSGVSSQVTVQTGEALGEFLAKVHNSTAGQTALLKDFNGNATAKYLSGTLYFGRLPAAAERFGCMDSYFRNVAEAGEHEVQNSMEVLTLGDFWTGNILVSDQKQGDLHLYVVDLELSKPGTAAFDIGQMAAEMYCLAAFRDEDLGMSLLRAFLRSYKENRQVDAAKVAIRIGAHLLVMMPSAWASEASQERIGEVAKVGADLISMGWRRDDAGLKNSIVGPLI